MASHKLYTVSSSSTTMLTPPGTHSGMDITLLFGDGTPINLSTADNFHIAGTYHFMPR